MEFSFSLCICRRHNSNATAGIYCKRLLCALKSNLVHLCLKFFLFVVVKIFQLLNMFYSGVDDSFIHCLKKKINLDYVVLVLKAFTVSIIFLSYLCICFIVCRDLSVSGELEDLTLPRFCQYITTEFLMLTLAPFIYYFSVIIFLA